MAKGQKDEAEAAKAQVAADGQRAGRPGEDAKRSSAPRSASACWSSRTSSIHSVPIGRDDSENVRDRALRRAGRCPTSRCPTMSTSWSASTASTWTAPARPAATAFTTSRAISPGCTRPILSYARDFMIDRGFTYYVPPFMIRGDVVTGVMSFCRDGEHDVQDRGRGPVPDRHERALDDRQVHRHHSRRKRSCPRR